MLTHEFIGAMPIDQYVAYIDGTYRAPVMSSLRDWRKPTEYELHQGWSSTLMLCWKGFRPGVPTDEDLRAVLCSVTRRFVRFAMLDRGRVDRDFRCRLYGDFDDQAQIERLAIAYHQDNGVEELRGGLAGVQDDLRRAVDALSGNRREALWLRYAVGMTNEEVASMLHVPPRDTTDLVRRAKAEVIRRVQQRAFTPRRTPFSRVG
jgi:DNA-directed RNA polymerase specialized sigma24 family protein